MYTDPTPLSLGSYKTSDGFDIYAQTEYPFESKQAQQDVALKMRFEHSRSAAGAMGAQGAAWGPMVPHGPWGP